MAEDTSEFFFDNQEVVEELIKKQGLHKGLWGLFFEIGLVGSNVNVLNKLGKTTLTPAGMVLISRIGIRKENEPSDLTVDAAEVNPKPEQKKMNRASSKTKK